MSNGFFKVAKMIVCPRAMGAALVSMLTMCSLTLADDAEGVRFFRVRIEPVLKTQSFACQSHQAGEEKGGWNSRTGLSVLLESHREQFRVLEREANADRLAVGILQFDSHRATARRAVVEHLHLASEGQRARDGFTFGQAVIRQSAQCDQSLAAIRETTKAAAGTFVVRFLGVDRPFTRLTGKLRQAPGHVVAAVAAPIGRSVLWNHSVRVTAKGLGVAADH